MTPKKLRARKSTGGWRHEGGEDEHERGRSREEPWSRPDEQDEPADEEPTDARLGRERARCEEANDDQAADREVRHHSAAEPVHERAEIETSGGPGRAGDARRDEGERDERPDQQDRVLPHTRECERREDRHERRGERATGREHEIELGQVRGCGPVLRETPVERDRDDAERAELHREHDQQRPAAGRAVGDP